MRDALSDALIAAARADKKFVLLTGDHGYALFDAFRAEFPDRYINAGIAEQNMVGVAAGMAMAGYHPAVYGLAAFVPIRVLEQIKLDVCYLNLPVIFIGDGAGVVYSTLGSSHQSTEDIAALRAVPNISILSPCDAAEMTACFELARELRSPVYLRVGKADLGAVHPLPAPPGLELGKLYRVAGNDSATTALVATGSMVSVAVEVAAQLEGAYSVWSAPSIKPIDAEQVTRIAESHGRIVALEEHARNGGFGSLIAEIVAETGAATVQRIGVEDRFTDHAGSYAHVMREHGLDLAAVVQRVGRLPSAAQ